MIFMGFAFIAAAIVQEAIDVYRYFDIIVFIHNIQFREKEE